MNHYRFWGDTPPDARTPITASIEKRSTDEGRTAVMRLYAPIDSLGGEWGVSAKEFTAALDSIGDDVEQIRVHINSPGGEVWEGIAILNALRNHKANVTTVIDGVAASAASFIAMAGDEIVMARNAEMMIHDAAGICIGKSEDMRDLAGRLDKISDNLASIYAERAGGTPDDWREAMRAETWYSADEAVEAGLATRVDKAKNGADEAKNHFDLSVFNYAGREAAPAPKLPAVVAHGTRSGEGMSSLTVHVPKPSDMPGARKVSPSPKAAGATQPMKGAGMPATIREALGLGADASDEEVHAAFASNFPQPASASAGEQGEVRSDAAPVLPTHVEGVVPVAQSHWDALHEDIKRLKAKDAKRERDERDSVIAAALDEGKFTPAQKDHFARLWDKDPQGTRDLINSLAKNSRMPVNANGFSGDPDDAFDEYAALFPPAENGA